MEKNGDLAHLKDFAVKEILDDYPDTKRIILEGRLAQDEKNPAIVTLEKMPFDADKVAKLLQSSALQTEFRNDIYGHYECFIEDPALNSLKANVIYPATQKHIAKYKSSPAYLIEETPALYQTVTLPHITQEAFSLDWVYNILDHQKETERIGNVQLSSNWCSFCTLGGASIFSVNLTALCLQKKLASLAIHKKI